MWTINNLSIFWAGWNWIISESQSLQKAGIGYSKDTYGQYLISMSDFLWLWKKSILVHRKKCIIRKKCLNMVTWERLIDQEFPVEMSSQMNITYKENQGFSSSVLLIYTASVWSKVVLYLAQHFVLLYWLALLYMSPAGIKQTEWCKMTMCVRY